MGTQMYPNVSETFSKFSVDSVLRNAAIRTYTIHRVNGAKSSSY